MIEIAGRVDTMVTEVVQNSALLRPHGVRPETSARNVMALHNDVTELRRGQVIPHDRLIACSRAGAA